MDRAAYLDHYVRELEMSVQAIVPLLQGFLALPAHCRRKMALFLVPDTLVWNQYPVFEMADNDPVNPYDFGHWLRPAFMAQWVADMFRVPREHELARVRVRLGVLEESHAYLEELFHEKHREFIVLIQSIDRLLDQF